jgi:hypothetical protein
MDLAAVLSRNITEFPQEAWLTNFMNLSYWLCIKAAVLKLPSPWSTSISVPYAEHHKRFFPPTTQTTNNTISQKYYITL